MNVNLTFSDETLYDYNQSYYYYDWIFNFTNYISPDEEDILKKLSITLYSIILVLGITGNGLVIWIAGFRMKKTVSAVWFLNLAIADFLCCASLSLRISEWVEYDYLLDDLFCQLSVILFYLNMSVSVLLLTAMSFDRYVSVIKPFWTKINRTCKLVRIIAAMIWVLSFLVTGLMFFLFPYDYRNINERCYIVSPYSNRIVHILNPTIQIVRLVIMFLIPFFIILISYVTIFFKVRKIKRLQRSQRPYRIITAVILCFFICWFPYYIWPLIPKYGGNYIRLFIIHVIIINLAGLNSCINPIIYVFMGKDFRHGFLRSIPLRVERALSEHPNGLCREGEYVQDVLTTSL